MDDCQRKFQLFVHEAQCPEAADLHLTSALRVEGCGECGEGGNLAPCRQTQKIAAFWPLLWNAIPVGAAEGCDLLIF